jgi:hypothetical protein
MSYSVQNDPPRYDYPPPYEESNSTLLWDTVTSIATISFSMLLGLKLERRSPGLSFMFKCVVPLAVSVFWAMRRLKGAGSASSQGSSPSSYGLVGVVFGALAASWAFIDKGFGSRSRRWNHSRRTPTGPIPVRRFSFWGTGRSSGDHPHPSVRSNTMYSPFVPHLSSVQEGPRAPVPVYRNNQQKRGSFPPRFN